jgi:hypothetical protein
MPNSSGKIPGLPDKRVQGTMPSTLPLSIMDAEGATYNALFSSISNLQAWAACGIQPATLSQQALAKAQQQQQQQQQQSKQQQPQPRYPAPEGWVTTKVITLPGLYNDKLVDVPTAVVLQDPNSRAACGPHSKKGTGSSQLLVLMRGAMLQTDYTWYGFASHLVEAPGVGPGLLHQGAGEARVGQLPVKARQLHTELLHAKACLHWQLPQLACCQSAFAESCMHSSDSGRLY